MAVFGGRKVVDSVTKGGPFRRWYGNHQEVLDYEDDGRRMQADFREGSIPGYSMKAQDGFYKSGITLVRCIHCIL